MEKLFIVTEFNAREVKKCEFLEEKIFVVIDNQKVYKSQFDDLILFGKNIVVITQNEEKIDYWKREIRDFYNNYHRG